MQSRVYKRIWWDSINLKFPGQFFTIRSLFSTDKTATVAKKIVLCLFQKIGSCYSCCFNETLGKQKQSHFILKSCFTSVLTVSFIGFCSIQTWSKNVKFFLTGHERICNILAFWHGHYLKTCPIFSLSLSLLAVIVWVCF